MPPYMSIAYRIVYKSNVTNQTARLLLRSSTSHSERIIQWLFLFTHPPHTSVDCCLVYCTQHEHERLCENEPKTNASLVIESHCFQEVACRATRCAILCCISSRLRRPLASARLSLSGRLQGSVLMERGPLLGLWDVRELIIRTGFTSAEIGSLVSLI